MTWTEMQRRIYEGHGSADVQRIITLANEHASPDVRAAILLRDCADALTALAARDSWLSEGPLQG